MRGKAGQPVPVSDGAPHVLVRRRWWEGRGKAHLKF